MDENIPAINKRIEIQSHHTDHPKSPGTKNTKSWYAVHTDPIVDRLYNVFDNYDEAESCRKEMQEGLREGDNYVVETFYAENETEAVERINNFRRERGPPSKD